MSLCSPAITKLALHASKLTRNDWKHHHTSLNAHQWELQALAGLKLAESLDFPPHCTIVVLCQFFHLQDTPDFNSPCGQVRERESFDPSSSSSYFQAFLPSTHTPVTLIKPYCPHKPHKFNHLVQMCGGYEERNLFEYPFAPWNSYTKKNTYIIVLWRGGP
jgi:hypothetical protein